MLQETSWFTQTVNDCHKCHQWSAISLPEKEYSSLVGDMDHEYSIFRAASIIQPLPTAKQKHKYYSRHKAFNRVGFYVYFS